ncbi:hypothetical protein ACLD0W_17540 [Alloalcanivorax sp. C16-1]|uniref:hypothetical protein n=1 Tax=Alloalcanivorax sp. C16-1 TaxID=3390051 RepID=UPI003970AC42
MPRSTEPAPRRRHPTGLYPLLLLMLAANLGIAMGPPLALPALPSSAQLGITTVLMVLLVVFSFLRLPPRHPPLWTTVILSLIWLAVLATALLRFTYL